MIDVNDCRYFIDPETLERIWVPRDYIIIRVANHPVTNKLIEFPRHQYQGRVTLVRESDTGTQSCVMDLDTRLVLVQDRRQIDSPLRANKISTG